MLANMPCARCTYARVACAAACPETELLALQAGGVHLAAICTCTAEPASTSSPRSALPPSLRTAPSSSVRAVAQCKDHVAAGLVVVITGMLLLMALFTMLQPKTVTTNWKDLDDIAGGRASGLDGVGAATAPNVRSGP